MENIPYVALFIEELAKTGEMFGRRRVFPPKVNDMGMFKTRMKFYCRRSRRVLGNRTTVNPCELHHQKASKAQWRDGFLAWNSQPREVGKRRAVYVVRRCASRYVGRELERTLIVPHLPGSAAHFGKVECFIQNCGAIILLMSAELRVHFQLRKAMIMHHPIWMIGKLRRVRPTETMMVTRRVLMKGRSVQNQGNGFQSSTECWKNFCGHAAERADGAEIRGDMGGILEIFDEGAIRARFGRRNTTMGVHIHQVLLVHLQTTAGEGVSIFFQGSREFHRTAMSSA